ncbi:N-formylglutamate amidohydrolase [Defluviimonas aestuarii]|uniref:N-formylglutamate amidohydrolase n=1 Tax=Albidovulum aestuarii TaxID=1130726 RepID=UPI002499E3B1|nr:N-formylglutamate amidohydrolase [Defluviimonas aestuarii]MDI3337722.1 N-formylglutamate amidohydrolase [Defluviimonas aestuarii]
MTRSPYDLTMPKRRLTGVVFASPHSGRDYPAGFLETSILDEHSIRSSEDAFIDQLLDGVTSFGAPLLTARAPRAYVDVNRAADEMDPALFEGVRIAVHNPRVASGLGVIPRVVAGGRAIYRGKLPMSEAATRIEQVWHPYHDCLRRLLDDARASFGQSILIDLHSMPHEAMDSIASSGVKRPEIVLGDRFGSAAAPEIVDRIEAAFEAAGFRTQRNAPFAGAYITQTYGRPSRGMHAVQIEMDRSLYMNEREIRPNGNFLGFKRILTGILAEIAEIGRGKPSTIPLAAE